MKRILRYILLFTTFALLSVSLLTVLGQSNGEVATFKIKVPKSSQDELRQWFVNGYKVASKEQGIIYMVYKGAKVAIDKNKIITIDKIRFLFYVIGISLVVIVMVLFIRSVMKGNNSVRCSQETAEVINLTQRLADLQRPSFSQFTFSYYQDYDDDWIFKNPKIDYSVYDDSNQFNLIRQYLPKRRFD